MTKFNDLDQFILTHNSCPFEVNKGMRGGIRVRLDAGGFEIDIRNANGDVEYGYCNKQHSI